MAPSPDDGLAALNAQLDATEVNRLYDAQTGPSIRERSLYFLPIIVWGVFVLLSDGESRPDQSFILMILAVFAIGYQNWILQRRVSALAKLVAKLVTEKRLNRHS